MSFLKDSAKFTGKRLTAPLKSVFVPQVGKQMKASKQGLSESTAPFCPQCLASRLELVDVMKNEGSTVERSKWDCFNCSFSVEVVGSSVSSVKKWIEVNGADVYRAAKLKGYSDESDEELRRERVVKKNVFVARVFLFVSFFFALSFLYACFTGSKFYALNSFLMVVCTVFLGIVNGYRAWQVKNDMLFSRNAKQQFHFWIKNYNWFAYPEVVSYPAEDEVEEVDND